MLLHGCLYTPYGPPLSFFGLYYTIEPVKHELLCYRMGHAQDLLETSFLDVSFLLLMEGHKGI